MTLDNLPSTPRLAALRYRDFRLIWFGQLVSIIGSQMRQTAIDWHIYEMLKGSSYSVTLPGQTINLKADAIGPTAIFTGGLATILLTIWAAWKYSSLRNYVVDERSEAQTAHV